MLYWDSPAIEIPQNRSTNQSLQPRLIAPANGQKPQMRHTEKMAASLAAARSAKYKKQKLRRSQSNAQNLFRASRRNSGAARPLLKNLYAQRALGTVWAEQKA